MPRKRAAFKRVRADKKRILRNQSIISEVKTKIKKIRTLIAAKDKEKSATVLRELISRIDKAKNKGIIHKKTAARWISRISKRVYSISAQK